jgi:hypothetical protein
LLSKLGLQNGDVLRSINGDALASPDSALAASRGLRSASDLALAVTRHGTNASAKPFVSATTDRLTLSVDVCARRPTAAGSGGGQRNGTGFDPRRCVIWQR